MSGSPHSHGLSEAPAVHAKKEPPPTNPSQPSAQKSLASVKPWTMQEKQGNAYNILALNKTWLSFNLRQTHKKNTRISRGIMSVNSMSDSDNYIKTIY